MITWLKIRCSDEKNFDFRPGQFINIQVNEDTYRSYSICSEKPGGDIELAVLTGMPGLGANYIKTLKKGSSVNFVGPSGRFFYHPPAKKGVLFVATSTGVAPFIPMIGQALEDPSVESVVLIFGVRDREDVFFEDKFKKFLEMSPKFSYFICLSGVTDGLKPPYFANRVTFCLPDFVKDETDFYLCGNTAMIRDCSDIINKAGLEDFAIYTEAFNPNL
ncbi:MAG: Ferredoxin-NAD(+) reductase [candidate division WWE3 bacterium GW2011_GWF1_42_14]|uniref:Ferredoxin-NAD(+) reductase n=1 Tax=candidate division WWE3 bacterium GW2011_GWF1_42_14 TaxID=1619138 RepID=A0A0G0YRL3_UNCKA|nr:MAG: Ferredoxin-NAD(+) reductase [candidate division WWE3 bacterium GW2011_GWA1_42_12]KKS34156.1 MAG: Ferredoxin-NAD(+) reductase [candidate division WWE3 bacterium GW2011_GWD1_42_14]KKS39270.1 MAG: Ferredoxin-NAD(+) reductase [candidate division WWE3 bacterium GW2011_GWF1_42_14]KKS40768.1 MAG: Ferredoxin-NAD(+) reductase [candidate division WWE3 bacterium GW2011_GWE1_42_16]